MLVKFIMIYVPVAEDTSQIHLSFLWPWRNKCDHCHRR